jgi:hypothetical protein
MILFAYAGNMNVEEFSKNVPSARKIGAAKLPGYTFVFNNAGEDDSAKANVEKSFDPDAAVWGILIELEDGEKSNFYNPDTWSSGLKLEQVACFDANDNLYHAEVFVAQPHAVSPYLLPYDWYHQKILKLAKQAELPEFYISQLILMPWKTDPDEERRQRRLKKL